ncbi:MAG: phage holin family protein [Firmicutes bacterium]|nr:phage holin family protein [Bacillota bacterium]
MEQNRFKSPVVWAALVAQVLAVMVMVGMIGNDMSDAIKSLVMAALQILVLVGVLNNPTNQANF